MVAPLVSLGRGGGTGALKHENGFKSGRGSCLPGGIGTFTLPKSGSCPLLHPWVVAAEGKDTIVPRR